MDGNVILEKQNMTFLKWSLTKSSSGTAGTFLKSESSFGNKKIYYKLSHFARGEGISGHECINELIVDRLLTVLGVEHLSYSLIHAVVDVDGLFCETYLCASSDFKEPCESKVALDVYYDGYRDRFSAESPYDFCKRMGFSDYIDTMIAVDYIIGNRDRHGGNIEILRNSRKRTLCIAPLFDHGVSLLSSCKNMEDIKDFDVMEDMPSNNFIGGKSCYENLNLLKGRKVFPNKLTKRDKDFIFEDLDGVISKLHIDKIWEMIYSRYKVYEKF